MMKKPIIKEFLDSKPNALVLLQEVPYKIKINGRWKECVHHKELYNDFSRNEYEVVGNIPKKSMISYFNGHQKVILYYSKRRKEST